MFAILDLIYRLAYLYQMILLAYVILGWLINFGIVDRYNRIVSTTGDVLSRLCEPLLQPVRNLLHRIGLNLGGLDLSPVILFLMVGFIQFLAEILAPAAPYIP